MAGPLLALWLSLIVAPARAECQDASSGADPSKSAPAEKSAVTTPRNEAQKPKKVWSNDDVRSLKSGVSVVGEKGQPPSQWESANDTEEEELDRRARTVRQYRDAIEQLRAQIGEADSRISQLKNFKADNGTPSGGIHPSRPYNMVPREEQIKQLEARTKEWHAKIEELENLARKEGIDPGELR